MRNTRGRSRGPGRSARRTTPVRRSSESRPLGPGCAGRYWPTCSIRRAIPSAGSLRSVRNSGETSLRNMPPSPLRRSSQLEARQAMSSRCRQPLGSSSVTSTGLPSRWTSALTEPPSGEHVVQHPLHVGHRQERLAVERFDHVARVKACLARPASRPPRAAPSPVPSGSRIRPSALGCG